MNEMKGISQSASSVFPYQQVDGLECIYIDLEGFVPKVSLVFESREKADNCMKEFRVHQGRISIELAKGPRHFVLIPTEQIGELELLDIKVTQENLSDIPNEEKRVISFKSDTERKFFPPKLSIAQLINRLGKVMSTDHPAKPHEVKLAAKISPYL